MMANVLVLYYSVEGKTEALAKAVADGVNKSGKATAVLKRVDRATIDDFISCDAVAFGSPNYFGYMAGPMKDFFDRAYLQVGEMPGRKSSEAALKARKTVYGKPAAAFTSGGHSSSDALQSIERMYKPFKLEKSAEGVVSLADSTEKSIAACTKMGEALANAAEKWSGTPKV